MTSTMVAKQPIRAVADLICFESYKRTSIRWPSQIPEGWDLRRLKFLSDEPISSGVGEAGDRDNPEWPRYIRITDIAGPRRLREDTFRSLPPEIARKARVQQNDLLLAAVGASFGKSYLHTDGSSPACYAGYLVRVSPADDVEPRFLAYWTESHVYWAQVESQVVQATIQNFSAGKYRELHVPVPPLPQQKGIADFLDRETAKIDDLIAKKERLLGLLDEKRTALITQAVTKGLDPNVPMKASGVDWLGEIPEHWDLGRMNQVVSRMIPGPFGSALTKDVYQGDSYRVYGQEQVIPEDFSRGDYYITEEKYRELRRFAVSPGDVLVSCVGTFGKAAVVPEDVEPGVINPRLIRIVLNQSSVRSQYLREFLRSGPAVAQLEALSRGGTMGVLNATLLSQVRVPVPPLDEQIAIEKTLSSAGSKLRQAGSLVKQAIERLWEYRSALITAAVTGKIDVQEHEA